MRSGLVARGSALGLMVLVSVITSGAGPGVHVRESDRLLEMLVEYSDEWAQRAQLEGAEVYLNLGSISPDFDHASDELTFGHSRPLFFHLLDVAIAEGNDMHIMFAVGGISHIAADALYESFFTPTLMASAPLGMYDLWGGVEGPRGESESITEGFGDLILGDWHKIADLLFALWLDSDEAKLATLDVLGWYCENGKAYFGLDTDCELVKMEIADKLATAQDYFGVLNKEKAHQLVDMFILQPLPELANTAVSGELTGMLGEEGVVSQWAKSDVERFKASPLCEPEFWTLYDEMQDLGPSWAFDFVTKRVTKSFPGWEGNGMASGNIRSIMAFLPELYSVHPDLTLRSLSWRDMAGNPISSISAGGLTEAKVVAEFYVARPFTGEVRGLVRKDAPGLDEAPGQVLGEASVFMDHDPLAYTEYDPIKLEIPFDVDISDCVGLYVDIVVGDTLLPTYTTNWDALWQIEDLDMDRDIYVDNFGSYGFWPPSLPVVPVSQEWPGALMVKVRQLPYGAGVEGTTVTLVPTSVPDEPMTMLSSGSGVALFEEVRGGVSYELLVEADGSIYAPVEAQLLEPAARDVQWVTVGLHRLPEFSQLPGWFDPVKGLQVALDVGAFQGQLGWFEVVGVDGESVPITAPVKSTDGLAKVVGWPALEDGDVVHLMASAVYFNEEVGAHRVSGEVRVDGSAPVGELDGLEPLEELTCLPSGSTVPYYPESVLTAQVVEPHSPVSGTVLCNKEPTEIPVEATAVEGDGVWQLKATLPANFCTGATGATLKVELQAQNGAGLKVVVSATEARSATAVKESCALPDPGPEPDPEDLVEETLVPDLVTQPDEASGEDLAPEPDAASTDVSTADLEGGEDKGGGSSNKGGGCAAQGGTSGESALLLLALLLFIVERRRVRR